MMLIAGSEAPAGTGQPRVTVLTDRCVGCQECVIRCPSGALALDSGRWVVVADDALCVGCRQCERTCPFGAITVTGPLIVAGRTEPEPRHPDRLTGDTAEVRRGFGSWDEALAEASRCLDCPDPTCVRGCPAHNDIPSFIAAIRDHELAKAHDVLRLTSVLPDVCSRVCDQAAQCEGACTWSLAGGTPVAIGKLERFVADNAPVPKPAGGMLGWGIPAFTLPPPVAARPWQQLIAAGVDLRCQAGVGPEDIGGLLTEHDAVVLAHGAGMPLRLPVPGGDLDGVTDATSFLRTGKAALAGGGADIARFRDRYGLYAPSAASSDGAQPRVLVLGAGNTALDVARTARRLGLRADRK